MALSKSFNVQNAVLPILVCQDIVELTFVTGWVHIGPFLSCSFLEFEVGDKQFLFH